MSDSSPRLGLPDLPDTPELYADTVAEAFVRLDAFTDLYLKGQFVDDPPASPADGDAYLIGGSPSGDWSGYPYKIATCRDGAWTKLAPFNGLRAFVEGRNALIVYQDGAWLDWAALIGAGEASIAAAATCDIGAAGSLFVAVTGTTPITSLGSGANRMRLLRFAGALTLTHDAASLVLPGAADIVTAAGDTAIFTSDGSGNWRCRHYGRASGQPVATALSVASLAVSGAVSIGGGSGKAVNVAGTTGTGIRIHDTAFAYKNGDITYEASGLTLKSGDALVVGAGTTVDFYPDNSYAGRFASDGSFLVGTTVNGGWGGNSLLETQAANGNAVSGYATSSLAYAAFKGRVDNASALLAAWYYGTTQVGTIATNGTTTSYGTTCDARLKRVPAEQADYRAAIRALWVGDFIWKDSGAPAFGVLAQQAWEVMPHHQGVTRPAAEAELWQASAEPFAHLAL